MLKRTLECAAMMMIGDGALGLLQPQRHMRLWENGPCWWRAMMQPFVRRPALTRAVGAAELAAGIWLAHRQQPHDTARTA